MQTVSEQAVVLPREEMERARRESTAKASQAAGGAAMLGGAALLGTLAAGTGTAFTVTAFYAAGGAGLAQEGMTRLRGAAPPVPEETVESVKESLGSMKKKKRAKPAKAPSPS